MTDLKLSDIQVSTWNPRKNFNPEELEELQASIEQYGILEPLIVRPVNSHYELVAGERRYRAAVNIGLENVPVTIREFTDAEVHEIMLIENLQRSSLEPLEEAQSLQVILGQGKVTQGELAAKLGKSQAWVANRLRLLQAPEELKGLLISREITSKHVLAALPYSGYPVFQKITEELQEKIREDKSCSVNEFNEIITDVVTKLYDNDYTFDLDNIPYDYRNYKPYMDFSRCEGCKHIVLATYYNDSQHRYCLNRKCWKDLANTAMNAYEKEREKAVEKLADASEVVDLSHLNYDEYKRIYDFEIDVAPCHPCDKCRKDEDNRLVCLDPKCYKKKQSARTREKNRAIKSERERVWNAVDTWIGSCQDLDARWMLKCLIFSCNENRVIKALSRWGKLESTNAYMHKDDVDNFVSSIPEDEVLPAIVRVLCFDRLEQYDFLSLEILERFVPAAVPFYSPAEASE